MSRITPTLPDLPSSSAGEPVAAKPPATVEAQPVAENPFGSMTLGGPREYPVVPLDDSADLADRLMPGAGWDVTKSARALCKVLTDDELSSEEKQAALDRLFPSGLTAAEATKLGEGYTAYIKAYEIAGNIHKHLENYPRPITERRSVRVRSPYSFPMNDSPPERELISEASPTEADQYIRAAVSGGKPASRALLRTAYQDRFGTTLEDGVESALQDVCDHTDNVTVVTQGTSVKYETDLRMVPRVIFFSSRKEVPWQSQQLIRVPSGESLEARETIESVKMVSVHAGFRQDDPWHSAKGAVLSTDLKRANVALPISPPESGK